jgi:uncharacterized protein YndB with AHSA1/START domain
VFEATHSVRSASPASAVWARWVRPERWPDWDARYDEAELLGDGDLREGSEVRVKMRKGGSTRQRVLELEPGTLLVTEYALPGARVGHEHVVEPRGPGSEVTHRLYVDGPLSGLWALMLGRKRLRETVQTFTDTADPRRPK